MVFFERQSYAAIVMGASMKRWLGAGGALLLTAALAVSVPAAAREPAGPRIVRERGTAAPSFVTGLRTAPRPGDAASAARAHLASNRARYHISDPARDLDVLRIHRTAASETVRFRQLHRGVQVFGAQYLVHMRSGGDGRSVTAVNGHFFTELTTSTEPRVSQQAAARLARAGTRAVRIDRVDSHGPTVLPYGEGVLTYHFTVWGERFGAPVRQEVFVGARAGGIVLSYNNLQADGPVTGSGTTSHSATVPLEVFQRGTSFEMRDQSRSMFVTEGEGEIRTHDAEGADANLFVPGDSNLATSATSSFGGANTSSGAVDAHWGAGQVFEFYEDLGRNSIDDAGMDIVSVVNAGDTGGAPLFNAFWNGEYMTYGNPDPSQLHPFSADLDVVGHELTHGVTQFSDANLVYLHQSGAMNEAYSDYFGNAIDVTVSGTPMTDPEAGFIGEDLCKVAQPTNWDCPLRDLNDGTTTDDFVGFLIDFDNGGVHLNSTIYGGALWDLRESAQLGPSTADDLVYRQLTEFLTPLDDFTDGRHAMLAAADAMGLTQAQKDAVSAAFDAKGIVDGWDTGGANDADVVMSNVAPIGNFFSPPQVSGGRFTIASYSDLTDLCCAPEQIFVGNLDGTGLQEVGDTGPDTFNDELPDLSGRRAVWSHLFVDGNGFNFDVQTRKLGGNLKVIGKGPGFQWFPSIDGDLVAWEDQRSQTDIRARFLGEKVKKVTDTPGEEFNPQASGNTVAWWDLGNFSRSPRIGLKNLKTGDKATIKVKSDAAFLGPPALSDKFVFWFQDKNSDGFGSIMRAKLNGKKKKVVVGEGDPLAPIWVGATPGFLPTVSANDDFVTYADEFGYATGQLSIGRDVWLVKASGGTPKLMTCNASDQAYPSIGNDKTVAWLDGILGRTDLLTRDQSVAGCPI